MPFSIQISNVMKDYRKLKLHFQLINLIRVMHNFKYFLFYRSSRKYLHLKMNEQKYLVSNKKFMTFITN